MVVRYILHPDNTVTPNYTSVTGALSSADSGDIIQVHNGLINPLLVVNFYKDASKVVLAFDSSDNQAFDQVLNNSAANFKKAASSTNIFYDTGSVAIGPAAAYYTTSVANFDSVYRLRIHGSARIQAGDLQVGTANADGTNFSENYTILSSGNLRVGTAASNNFTVTALSGNTVIAGTLNVGGVTTISNNATISGTLGVTGLTSLSSVNTSGNDTIGGTLTVTGATVLNGGLTMDTNKFIVADNTGNTSIAGTLSVTGNTSLSSVNTSGNDTVGGNLTVSGNTSLSSLSTSGNLTVTGITALNGGLTMDTDRFIVADNTGNTSIAGTLFVTGATVLNGGLTMDTDRFTVADNTGNTSIAGTLSVTGNTSLSSITASNNASISGSLSVTGATVLNGGLTMDTDRFTVADNTGNTSIAGTLSVTGNTSLSTILSSGTLTVSGATALNGGLTMDTDRFTVADGSGNTSIAGTLSVTGNTSISSLSTSSNTSINGTLSVTGATVLNGGLTMDTDRFVVADNTGNTSIAGTLSVTGATNVTLISSTGNNNVGGTLTVTGATLLNGGLSMDTNKFVVADNTGDTTIAGTLSVTGATSLSSLSTSGNDTIGGTLTVTGAASSNTSFNAPSLLQSSFLLVPTGTIVQFAGSSSPGGWLFCDGSAVSRTTYSTLFGVVNTTYGAGNGTTTFNVPNFKGKIPVCYDNTQTEFDVLGETGGEKKHTLTVAELPAHSHTGTTDADGSHTHTINDPGHAHTQTTVNDDFNNSGTNPPGFSADSAGSRTWSNINSATTGITINANGSHTHTFTTNNTGSGTAFNVLQPYIVVQYIIKY